MPRIASLLPRLRSLPDPAAITWPVLHTLREPRTPWETPSSLLAEYPSRNIAPWFFLHRFRERRRRRGCDTVVKDRMPPPPPSSSPPLLPRVTRGQMIYRRTVVAAYKTVIMFYHPGQSTETATEPAHETSGQPIRGHITNNEILLSYWKSQVGVLYRRLYIVER